MKKLSRVEKLKAELKIAVQIEKTNKIFKSLSKAEKRMFIAKDVIDSIKAKKLIATPGTYVVVNKNYSTLINQDVLCASDTICNVCGIGALFVSKVKIDNNFNSEIEGDEEIRDVLSTYFSRPQLALIEAAFEGWEVDYLDDDSDKLKLEEKCIKFHNKYKDDGDRMIAIMKNIISNKGLFKI